MHSGLEQASNVVQVVLGTLLVLFSFNLIFLCVGFQEYSARAEAIETKALGMWDASGGLDEHDAEALDRLSFIPGRRAYLAHQNLA